MSEFTCKFCNENMEGDGYSVIFHCPSAKDEAYDSLAPDSNAVYCVPECETCRKPMEGDGKTVIFHCKEADPREYMDLDPEETPVPCCHTNVEQNWDYPCDTCGAKPTVGNSEMCGPCFFGSADTVGGNW